jgi:hypothetical protein
MDENRLRKWLKTQDRQEGIEIYETLKGSDFKLKLIKTHDNEYTRGLIEAAVVETLEELAINNSIKAPESAPTPDFFSLPEILQRMTLEKGQLFKQTLSLRRELKQQIWPELRKVIKQRNTITVNECCEMMKLRDREKRAVPFSVSFITYDKEQHTGGELIHYEHATLTMPNVTGSRTYTADKYNTLVKKNPRHWLNSTRDIHPLGSQSIRKLHIWLMFEFNGCEVVMGDAG